MKKSLLILWLLTQLFTTALAQEEAKTEDLYELSLEELMNVEITSVSKQAEKLQDVASSIYVISQEDIRRSGATRVQDLIQMVPGAFFNFNNYNNVDFGMRENTNGFLGSVLVLVDNVPYQSPYTSAFEFADFDFDLAEIDRIEVIKGPGGTIYGANAATGVINIFTKKAEDSQGWRFAYNQGTRGLIAPAIRYGTTVGEKSHLKVFAKGNFFNGFEPLDEFNGPNVTVPVTDLDPVTGAGLGTSSGTATIQNGLNEDVYRTEKMVVGTSISSQLEEGLSLSAYALYTKHKTKLYFPVYDQSIFLTEQNNSRFVSSVRLDKSFSEKHSMFGQLSTNKEILDGNQGIRSLTTFNFELQDNLTVGINNISAGVNLRGVDFRVGPIAPALSIYYTDPNTSEYLWGAFVQNRLKFGDKLDVTVGVKAETWTLIDNKPEWSPSARFSFRPTDKITLWGAGSRSVTTPGFIQTNIELTLSNPVPPFIPLRAALVNSDDMDQSEYLTGEFGVKATFNRVSLDVSAFYIEADNQIGLTGLVPTPIPSPTIPSESILPVYYANIYKSTNYGTETVLKWFPSSKMKFELSHAWFVPDTEGKTNPLTGQPIIYTKPEVPDMPEHVVRLRTYLTLGETWELTLNGIYNTATGSGRFLYDQQRVNSLFIPGDRGVEIDPAKDRVRLDFKLEKFFNGKQASIFVWGTDVLNVDGTMMNYNSFQTGIPMQVHALVGLGVAANLN